MDRLTLDWKDGTDAVATYIETFVDSPTGPVQITLEKRALHCDRGRWIGRVDVDPATGHGLDRQEGWPRYYFDLDRAKAEIEDWVNERMKKRGEQRPLNAFEFTLSMCAGNRVAASEIIARGLMAGDPAEQKAGYEAESATLAAGEAYGLEDDQVRALAERLDADVEKVMRAWVLSEPLRTRALA